ncbi:MAG: DEAD/DEAH box helicase [Deltaproteobacteria bacterium]|nr:DEAD/DEAH box helicase [Deltaproteobacteria bacterium]
MTSQLALPMASTALVRASAAALARLPHAAGEGGSILSAFHPVIQTWFTSRFRGPTEPQARGWAEILAGRDTLIAAPTGSGKTLAAFLTSLDRLYRAAEGGGLEDRIEVVYVSPLKALSNDIQRNLDEPLAQLAVTAAALGYPPPEIRTWVRTGDTPAAERQKALKKPPHILITTPESLYLMVTAEKSREVLRHVRTVIVDEIHALVRDKRGSHLSLTLARLDHVCHARPARIGLSATQRPIEQTARYLVGAARVRPDGEPVCSIVDAGHLRTLKLEIATPTTELAAVASGEQWNDLYERLAELIRAHRTTLVFVNTRRAAERVAHALVERLGEEAVASHHGSLSKERRHDLEKRLKAGRMKAVVATASLELGIDVGTVDLVCQLRRAAPIAVLPRVAARAQPRLGQRPHCIPFTRDHLVECAACWCGRCRAPHRPPRDAKAPLDIVAQQIVAECSSEPWREDDLFELVREAWPFADLERAQYDALIAMLSEGIPTGNGRAAAHLHRDRIHGVVRGRRGARMVAVQCGGAIPELADYKVIAEPEGMFVGTVDEDFAIESMAGDIFLLGTTSWKIQRVESGVVRVENAHGAPPSIPFWFGEAPGARSRALRGGVSALRSDRRGRSSPAPTARSPARCSTARAGLRSGAAAQAAPLHPRPEGGAGRAADHHRAGAGAVLRRERRQSGGAARALRQPHQPRHRPHHAQALLPQLRLRAAGGGHRRRGAALARRPAELPARRPGGPAAPERRPRDARPGAARGADVRRALALERHPRAGDPAPEERPPRAAADPAHARRGPARRGLPAPGRVPGERHGPDRGCPSTRSSTRRSTTACTRRWTSTGSPGCSSASAPARSACTPATPPSRRRSPTRSCRRSPTRSSTTRPSRSAARAPCRPAACSPTRTARSRPSTRRRSHECARRRGPTPAT